MERRVGGAGQPVAPALRQIRDGLLAAKQAADVHAALCQPAQPDVAGGHKVQFQIGRHHHVAGMDFQPEQPPAVHHRRRAPAAGAHDPFAGVAPPALLGPQFTAEPLKFAREPVIQNKT